jgi:CRISPR/Cas system-associated protein Cas5 (RAMP superfamily)
MKAITLRNLPPELAKAVRREAERKRTSVNKAVISLLESKADVRKKKRAAKMNHQELDALAGSWTKNEAAEFDKALAAQRSIDPELWK